jgi:hypothetical protein
MPTTITVPVIGPAPTVRSRVFLDPHGAEYVGVGRQKRTHVVALVAGVVQKVSGDAATIQLFESHPAYNFVHELAEEGHLKLVGEQDGHGHLVLQESYGSNGLQESVSTESVTQSTLLQESRMKTVPKLNVRRALECIATDPDLTVDMKARGIFRLFSAKVGNRNVGRERLTELRESLATSRVRGRSVSDILRGCRRPSVQLTESAQQPDANRFKTARYILRHCSR